MDRQWLSSQPTLKLPPSTSPLRHLHRRSQLAAATLQTQNADTQKLHLPRRSLLLLSTSLSIPATAAPPPSHASPPPQLPTPDTTITDRVYMDFSLCPNYLRSDRTVSDDIVSLCSESIPLGRLVLGLYGHHVPITVANFKSMCTSSNGSTYKNTLIHKIFPGQFFLAGRQGRPDKGEVRPPSDLPRNIETVDSRAFSLPHSKGGLLSLCLSENDDYGQIKLDPDYRNVEFMITTGPGPSPHLDSKNIVFGVVLEGLDVVTTIAAIPTYKPGAKIRQFNDLAEFIGDGRAQNARGIWNRPLKTVFISACGDLEVTKPSLSPTLP